MVWEGSLQLGIGRAETTENGMKCAYIVGRYKPAGNMIGQFTNNVKEGNFNRENYCSSVTSKKRKFFDKSGKSHATGTPLAAVGVSGSRTQDSAIKIELLKEKKKKHFVNS